MKLAYKILPGTGFSDKPAVKHCARDARQRLCDRKCQPKPVQPEPGENISEWHKQHDRAYHGERGAFHAGPHRLKEYGKDQRCDHRQKAYAYKAEPDPADEKAVHNI